MKKTSLFSVFSSLFIFLLFNFNTFGSQPELTKGWKVGIARGIITPEEPIWLAGYASRNHPSEGTLVDLWVKVLAIEDAKGKKAVLITSDLLGFP